MSWFNLRASNRGRVIVDIGSASVSANIVADNKVLFSVSREIVFSDNLNFQEFLTKTVQTLEVVVKIVHDHSAGSKIRSYHLFLSSPLYLATTQTSSHLGPTPFVVNERLLGNLLKTKIVEVSSHHQTLYPGATEEDWDVLEKKMVSVRLDGYEIKNYLGRQTDKLEIDWFFTLSSKKIIQRLKETVQKVIWTEDIVFHSFIWGAYEALNDLDVGKNFLLVDVSGELTDVAVISDGVIREHLSFPFGRNSLLKKFNKQSQTTDGVILSQIRALAEGHLSPHVAKNLSNQLKPIADEWLGQFGQVLKAINETTYVPGSLFLVGEDQTAELFASWLDDKNFSDMTYTHHPFQTTVISAESLHQALEWPNKVSHNAFLILETIYCDKIEGSN